MKKQTQYQPINEEPQHFGYGLLLYAFMHKGERIHMCREDMRAIGAKHPHAMNVDLLP